MNELRLVDSLDSSILFLLTEHLLFFWTSKVVVN